MDKSFLDKTFYYLNELYGKAVERRNTAIEVANRLESIAAATQINDHITGIEKIHRQALEKMRSALKEAEGNFEKPVLDENAALWQQACDKIEQEATSLKDIADDVADSKLQPPLTD